MRDVTVLGIGETAMGRYPERGMHQMVREAGEAAIQDAGIGKEQIQAAYVGNFDGAFLTNQNHFGPYVTETLGIPTVPAMRVEGACASGGLALRSGYMAVASGMYDIVLVGGVEKMTHQPSEVVTTGVASAMDFELEALQGMTFPANFAMIANRYFHEYRDVKREMGICAVNAHHNATLNPHAQMPKELDLGKVLEAGMIAEPLSLFDCSLVTDGAAFVVLAAAEVADSLPGKGRAVDILASAHAGDALTLAAKPDITSFRSTKAAAARAYAQAGVTPADIDFAEVHDCFTITQIINTEDLGFFAPGTGGDAVAGGLTALEGAKPINPSGGLKAKGHPIGATGISQLYEVVTQLRGEAGPRQLKKANLGLTHNLGGTAATCVIHILRRRG